MNELIGLILGAVLFLCSISAYIMGLKHGKELSKGNVPKIDINPVKPIIKIIDKHEEKKKTEELVDDLDIMMSYTKETALDYLKNAR